MTSATPEPAYDTIGRTYTSTRRADPRIARQIRHALGAARSVVNVGAGTGNYEPIDRLVVAVEPSSTMIEQRGPGTAPAVRGIAERLPFADDGFDASMATLTLHHWADLAAGLAEMRRVARRQVIFSFDQDATSGYWLVDEYFPDYRSLPSEASAPDVADIAGHLHVRSVEVIPVPADCSDGFGGAYWNRPEAHLDPLVLAGMSWIAQMDPAVVEQSVRRLATDLADGTWDARHGHLREMTEIDLGYRLVIAGD